MKRLLDVVFVVFHHLGTGSAGPEPCYREGD
jgi:hypothetical protein